MTIPPKAKMIGENSLVYAIAAGVIWFVSRGISVHKEIHDFLNADLWVFVPAALGSFLIWFFGENLLFARLFTHFHKHTGYVEMLPATAAAYFLQALNVLVADGALVVFLHRRKGVPWFASGFTLAFFGFLDGIIFSALITVAGFAAAKSPIHAFAPYAAGAFALFILIAAWWRWRKPRFRLEKWIHDRPSLKAFREATLPIYAELLAIRFGILAPQGFLLWISFRAFHLHIPLAQVLAMSPAILAAGGAPITPSGLGPLQAVAVKAFSRFSPKAKIMAASLAFGLVHLACRLPLGLGSARFFVKRVLEAGGDPSKRGEDGDRETAAVSSHA